MPSAPARAAPARPVATFHYTVNPKTPFAAIKANPETVDFLKFPRQTLSYRAGDCSDLSILYASIFESVGIETAFITVPGHIFMAFALDTQPAKTGQMAQSANLIVQNGKTRIPIETTIRDGDFMAAWAEGVKQWKSNTSAGTAAFYPVHDAWKIYQPVGLAADSSNVTVPEAAGVSKAFVAVLGGLVEKEVASRVASINDAMKRTGQTPKALNDRGVVYARFGKLELAMADFRAASAKDSYLPSLVNLGNVFLLKEDFQGAYDAYRRASVRAPENAMILATLVTAAFRMGKADEAGKAMDRVKLLDPALAAELAQVVQAGSEGSRAAEVDAGSDIYWIQE